MGLYPLMRPMPFLLQPLQYCFFAAGGMLFFIYPWACVIAYTRIYLGVHYPGDILGGILLGTLVGWGIFRLLLYIEDRAFPVHPYQRNKLTINELETITISATMVVFFTFSTVVLMLQNDLL